MISRFPNMFAKVVSNVLMIIFPQRSGSLIIYKFYTRNKVDYPLDFLSI